MIARSGTHIGLPKSREEIATWISVDLGTPPLFSFPHPGRKDGSERRQTPAILVFDEPVCGSVLIGAGRFREYRFFGRRKGNRLIKEGEGRR